MAHKRLVIFTTVVLRRVLIQPCNGSPQFIQRRTYVFAKLRLSSKKKRFPHRGHQAPVHRVRLQTHTIPPPKIHRGPTQALSKTDPTSKVPASHRKSKLAVRYWRERILSSSRCTRLGSFPSVGAKYVTPANRDQFITRSRAHCIAALRAQLNGLPHNIPVKLPVARPPAPSPIPPAPICSPL